MGLCIRRRGNTSAATSHHEQAGAGYGLFPLSPARTKFEPFDAHRSALPPKMLIGCLVCTRLPPELLWPVL